MKILFAKLLGIGSALWEVIAPLLRKEAQDSLTKLAPIATSVVTEIAISKNLTNSKRDTAYAAVKSAAVDAGIDFTSQLLDVAITTAVAKLKAASEPVTK